MVDTVDNQAEEAAPVGEIPPAAPSADSDIAIALQGISKSFGAVQANRDVNLTIRKGSVHGIVGENGAGKSTLMSILYGFYEADSGTISVDGKPVKIHSSQAAIAVGIGMVHQHFMLIDTFTVLENIILGAESGALLAKSVEAARTELERLEREYGLLVDLDARISDLPVGEQQRVEILKALYRGARVLILDEPTGVLTPQEADQLFRILDALKDQGVTIVLITHKLREVMAITDAVSVMRRGKMVAHRETAKTSVAELAELMVGRKVRGNLEKGETLRGNVALKVQQITVGNSGAVPLLDNVSFSVRSGEIVGIAGVSGNGQSELLEVLSGIRKIDSGRITIRGREITPKKPFHPSEARDLKVAHVPEDRHRLGLVIDFTAQESSILGYHRDENHNSGLFHNQTAIGENCEHLMEEFDVRPRDPSIISANMSGGNQQKLILAREIDKKPEVLLVGQPTRGVDIGAIEFIHRQLLDLRQAGCAILMVSVELEEVMSLADRVLVMFGGRIVAEVLAKDADEKTLGLMMTNAHTQEPELNDRHGDAAT